MDMMGMMNKHAAMIMSTSMNVHDNDACPQCAEIGLGLCIVQLD